MYVKDPKSRGLVTDMAVAILSDYIDALVSGEEVVSEEFLRHAPDVDRETLVGLFRVARELKGVLSREYIPSGVKRRIWQDISRRLES